MLRNLFRLTLYLIGFAAAGAIAAFMLFKVIDYGKTVDVPLLVGKNITEADELLRDSGLSMEIAGESYSKEIPTGHIISQETKQGERVNKGSGIRVIINKEKMVTTPFFEGMHIKDVKRALSRLGLKIGKITRVHSYTVEKNRVITQRPLPGYFSGNKVNLVVSSGPYDVSYRCPAFTGMTTDEARKAAEALGLKLIEHEKGRVIIFQKPEAGAIVKKGDSVEVTLGRGEGFSF